MVAAAQDRWAEKQLFARLGIPTAVSGRPEVMAGAFAEGTIVKRRTGGFDGRGQVRLEPSASHADLLAAAAQITGPCLAEGLVRFDRELSVVAARSCDGAVAVYPVVENRHQDGILRETIAPAPGATPDAGRVVIRLMEALDHVGVMALELFEVDGALLANELAPRVHNSGHWTIEGAVTSQFEQHLRAVCGLPLGDPSPRGPSGMVNVIGVEPDPSAVLAVPGAHLHRYGKAARPERKLGHVTVVGVDAQDRDDRMAAVRRVLAG